MLSGTPVKGAAVKGFQTVNPEWEEPMFLKIPHVPRFLEEMTFCLYHYPLESLCLVTSASWLPSELTGPLQPVPSALNSLAPSTSIYCALTYQIVTEVSP